MLSIEFNWTADVYSARFGDTFTAVHGIRHMHTIQDWRDHLAGFGMNCRKVDSRTWEIYMIEVA